MPSLLLTAVHVIFRRGTFFLCFVSSISIVFCVFLAVAAQDTITVVFYLAGRLLLLPTSHLPSGHAALYPELLQSSPASCCQAHARTTPTSNVGRSQLARALSGSACTQATRGWFGLPPRRPGSAATASGSSRGFVFAYFGQHLKIDSRTFAHWMSILRRSPLSK